MTMYINNNKVCPICCAYENSNGYCSNGHLFKDPITKVEFIKKYCWTCEPGSGSCSHCDIMDMKEEAMWETDVATIDGLKEKEKE